MLAIKASNGSAEIHEVPKPNDDSDGVLVRVVSSSICGSDLHMLDMGILGDSTLGHEFAGTLTDGTAVAVEPTVPCGTCAYCADEQVQLCATVTERLVGVGVDGGMAEFCLVHPDSIVILPNGLEPQDACIVEPTAISLHAARRGRVADAERVCVVGGGAIGLTSVAASRQHGAAVTLVARHDHQLAAGERFGATSELAGESRSDGFDVVFDAVGSRSSLNEAVRRARPGGRIIMVGSYWDGSEFPAMEICLSEIDLIPASMYDRRAPRVFAQAAELVATSPELASTLITHRFPLDAATEAFAAAADRKAGSIRVVFEP
jgi:2-desacetyl-2-hydroxyethyl bacteriochlorophyllide A dehydrogenase